MKKFNDLLEDIYASQYKIKKIQTQNPETGEWEWHDRKIRTSRIDFKNSKMGAKPSQENEKDMNENVVTKKYSWGTMKTVHHKNDFSIPLHPEHHQAIAKLGDEQEHHFKDETGRHWTARRKGEFVHFQGANNGGKTIARHSDLKEGTVNEEVSLDEEINEVLSKDASAGEWIHDFVHSDNPKFAGKPPEKRRQMALAAYYAKQRNEEVESIEELETKTLKSYINKNIKSGRADDGGKGDTGLYKATNKVARKLATSTLDKKVNKLGNTSALQHNNPYEYDASRSELKNRGTSYFAGRRTRTEESEIVFPNKTAKATSPIAGLRNDIKKQSIKESMSELDKHIATFSGGIKSSGSQHTTYKQGGGKIHNMKHVSTDASHQDVFNHLKKMGYKKTSGYDPKPNEFDMHHNRDTMTSKSDPVHHTSGISAHVEKEHGGKMKVHFTHNKLKEQNMQKSFKGFLSELTGKQKKIDKNHNGKLDAQDFKILRHDEAKNCPECGEPMSKCSCNMNESFHSLDEGKMNKMSLSGLWHAHAHHSYLADQGYGHGSGSMGNNEHAATAIENHVRKTHGNNVANDMLSHSDHHVAHAEYAGPEESKHHEKESAKLRSKHNISGSLYGMNENKSYAPVAPVPDKKYIKGTPENKAHKEKMKSRVGHPTNVKEGMEDTLHPVGAALLKHIKPEHHNLYKPHLAKDTFNGSFSDRHAVLTAAKQAGHLKEAFINGREYASQGKMHPTHAAMPIHQVNGNEVDFYANKTGNKMLGKVVKNTGKEVHIQAHKELGNGKLHKFKVTPHLSESADSEDDIQMAKIDLATIVNHIERLEPHLNKELDLPEWVEAKITLAADYIGCVADYIEASEQVNEEKKEMDIPTKAVRTGPKSVEASTEEGWEKPKMKKEQVSYTDFMSSLLEYESDNGVYRHTKKATYGTEYQGDEDDEKKKVAKPVPGVKRGRGRPAGSKSGANQKVTTGKSSGVDYTGYKLHLPNSNR